MPMSSKMLKERDERKAELCRGILVWTESKKRKRKIWSHSWLEDADNTVWSVVWSEVEFYIAEQSQDYSFSHNMWNTTPVVLKQAHYSL